MIEFFDWLVRDTVSQIVLAIALGAIAFEVLSQEDDSKEAR